MFSLPDSATLISSTSLQRNFGETIEAAQSSDLFILRNNEPIAALVSAQRLSELYLLASNNRRPTVPSAARHFCTFIEQAQAPIDRVILFGSYARGTFHHDSDIDLLVISEQDSSAFSQQLSAWSVQASEQAGNDELLSIMHMNEARWQELLDAGALLAREILEDGIVVWHSNA